MNVDPALSRAALVKENPLAGELAAVAVVEIVAAVAVPVDVVYVVPDPAVVLVVVVIVPQLLTLFR